MKILVTLGPTHEPVDEVRYITTASSGKMGRALAIEGLKRKHKMTIVSGPVGITLPEKASVITVRTAAEMIDKTLSELAKGYDVFISAAAIADYSPAAQSKGKIGSGKKDLVIKLKNNPKLTLEARKRFPSLYIVAFKAEYDVAEKELMEKASTKLKREDLDLICANDIGTNRFGSDESELIVMGRGRVRKRLKKDSKENLAKNIWDLIEEEKK
jgi:phosphopantothenoylcysteine decarboxylase/phosphopantothenate--cysteine ligase